MLTAWALLVVSRAPLATRLLKAGLSKPAAALCTHFNAGALSRVTKKLREAGDPKSSTLIQPMSGLASSTAISWLFSFSTPESSTVTNSTSLAASGNRASMRFSDGS